MQRVFTFERLASDENPIHRLVWQPVVDGFCQNVKIVGLQHLPQERYTRYEAAPRVSQIEKRGLLWQPTVRSEVALEDDNRP